MIDDTYAEKVYSGVLGKIIGVYLGRPFENWTFEKITSKFGQIDYYVHEELSSPLVVTDDDIAGTFTFLRALQDYDNSPDLSPYQIGQTWLNYLVENKSVLWWGGMGNSTEHTAYLRLKSGIHAPMSGSLEKNGKIISEQIGAQIFIDGWAMLCPGDPERAVDFARRAASVSHDGEAIYCAQIMAAMEAMAFIESDLQKILDVAVGFIPNNSVTYRMINDLRNWHNQLDDWKIARKKIVENYGYEKYLGNCHVIPNHALIQLGLLYGRDDFQKSLMITNTCGWDTDCNSGNVGCFLGIKNGLSSIDQGPDWRGPVADRLFLSTADGGRCVTDAVQESLQIIGYRRAMKKQEPLLIKNGAKFNFEFPGSKQGFQLSKASGFTGKCSLENTIGHSVQGSRSLEVKFLDLYGDHAILALTPTFILPEEMDMPGYTLMASPTIYSGQVVRSSVNADSSNNHPVKVTLNISIYQDNDQLVTIYGPEKVLLPGEIAELSWQIPDTAGAPIALIGYSLSSEDSTTGSFYIDYLTWEGTPNVIFKRPGFSGKMWRRAWINAVDHFDEWPSESFRLVQDHGRGMIIQGSRGWADYSVSADITPQMMRAGGICANVQGLRRYYSLMLSDEGMVKLVKTLDGDRVIAEKQFAWSEGETYLLSLNIHANHIQGLIDNQLLIDVVDEENPLDSGSVGLICEEGCFFTDAVYVHPVEKPIFKEYKK